MAVTTLTTEIEVPERYPTMPASATKFKFVFTAPSAFAEGIQFAITGREVILVQNTAGGAGTFTIGSVRDQYGRLGDITTYSVAGNGFAYVPLGAKELFGAAGGTILITMSAATIKVAVLQMPNMV